MIEKDERTDALASARKHPEHLGLADQRYAVRSDHPTDHSASLVSIWIFPESSW